jgi:hypothetical protein
MDPCCPGQGQNALRVGIQMTPSWPNWNKGAWPVAKKYDPMRSFSTSSSWAESQTGIEANENIFPPSQKVRACARSRLHSSADRPMYAKLPSPSTMRYTPAPPGTLLSRRLAMGTQGVHDSSIQFSEVGPPLRTSGAMLGECELIGATRPPRTPVGTISRGFVFCVQPTEVAERGHACYRGCTNRDRGNSRICP